VTIAQFVYESHTAISHFERSEILAANRVNNVRGEQDRGRSDTKKKENLPSYKQRLCQIRCRALSSAPPSCPHRKLTYEELSTRSAKTIHSQICLEDARANFTFLFIVAFSGVSVPDGDFSRSGW